MADSAQICHCYTCKNLKHYEYYKTLYNSADPYKCSHTLARMRTWSAASLSSHIFDICFLVWAAPALLCADRHGEGCMTLCLAGPARRVRPSPTCRGAYYIGWRPGSCLDAASGICAFASAVIATTPHLLAPELRCLPLCLPTTGNISVDRARASALRAEQQMS